MQHAFSYILKETCKTVARDAADYFSRSWNTITGWNTRYKLETEIQAQLHVSTIVSYIY